jgi:hypothetical protein
VGDPAAPVSGMGGLGVPRIELEPKPPAVDDVDRYITTPPLVLSERCRYWVRQLQRGFVPNRRWRMECGDSAAALWGVYWWEWTHVLEPAVADRLVELAEPC